MSGWETARKAVAFLLVILASTVMDVPPGPIQTPGGGSPFVVGFLLVFLALGLVTYDHFKH
ncbi:hypothetical protein LCGC14_1806610 [marine sediment metagenome]|uniref:Uncharacterized protein n=1 Tax=marine sediment metagenome TaxID=412755 RepID=A0A0F9HAW6_9ZZZZ